MYKFLFSLTLIFSFSLQLFSQTEMNARAKRFRENPNYYCGDGIDKDLATADKSAMSDLIGKISTNVYSEFSGVWEQEAQGNELKFKEKVQSVVRSYSFATLDNVEQIIINDGKDGKSLHVFRYVEKKEVEKSFVEREAKVKEHVSEAIEFERKLKIDLALKHYYWALMLLHSNPQGSAFTLQDLEGKERKLYLWLPQKIDEILQNIEIEVSEVQKEKTVENYDKFIFLIRFLYQKKLMENKLEYSYFNGVRQTKNCEAKDGRGIAVFDQLPSDFFKLAIEYQYLKEAERFDPELAMVINSLYLQPFKCASKTVSTKLITPPIIEKPITPTSKDKRSKESSALIDTAVLETIMQKVESAIRTKNLSPAKPLFTENGWKMFTALLENGDYSIISKPILSFTSLNGLVVCKSIPMQFRFKTNNKDFIEDVAFRFNEEKKISSISFTLTKQAVADLLDKEKEWDEKSKNILMQFLEDYQTAYALKRIDYLEKIFSDSALIIIGTELKNTVLRPEQQQFINSSTVVYEKKNKATFIADLARNFKSKSYINLRFEDISMAKSKSAEIYGVQVKQNYYSSNYNDKGYLTLLLDLTDTLPIIHVRVWQKEKNEKLSPKTIISVPYGWENGNW